MFSFGEFKQEDQDKMLAALNRKVAEVYSACIGQNEANIGYVNCAKFLATTFHHKHYGLCDSISVDLLVTYRDNMHYCVQGKSLIDL